MCKMFTMITEPARKIPRRYTGVSGDFPSEKNNTAVAYESLMERNYMLLLEFEEDVASYVGQPIRIPYDIPGEKKPRRSRYTPDILIYYKKDRAGKIRPPGNPSIKQTRLKVEFSKLQILKVLHENIPLFRQPDHCHSEAGRGWLPRP